MSVILRSPSPTHVHNPTPLTLAHDTNPDPNPNPRIKTCSNPNPSHSPNSTSLMITLPTTLKLITNPNLTLSRIDHDPSPLPDCDACNQGPAREKVLVGLQALAQALNLTLNLYIPKPLSPEL